VARPGEWLPPYLAFMLEFSAKNPYVAGVTKKEMGARLEKAWRNDLGPRTKEKVEAMAMLLGAPDREKGGLTAFRILTPSNS
jgi:hypothetical protein